jgi:hypothetical protein
VSQGQTSTLLLFGLHSKAVNTNRHCVIRVVQCRIMLFGLHNSTRHRQVLRHSYCINTNRHRVILSGLHSEAIVLELQQRPPLSIRTRPPSPPLLELEMAAEQGGSGFRQRRFTSGPCTFAAHLRRGGARTGGATECVGASNVPVLLHVGLVAVCDQPGLK